MALLTPSIVGTPGAASFKTVVSGSTSLTPGAPSGYAVGDVLVCATAEIHGGTGTPASAAVAVSGWTKLSDKVDDNSTMRIAFFAKVAASTSEAAPTVSWTGIGTGADGKAGARVFACHNVDISSLDVDGAATSGTVSVSVCGGAVTTLQDKDLVIAFTLRNADQGTLNAPTGFTDIATYAASSSPSMSIGLGSQVKTPAGATSGVGFTVQFPTGVRSGGNKIALKAAQSATTFNDTVSGSLVLSGTRTESRTISDARSGSLTLVGSQVESKVYADTTVTVTLHLSGTMVETWIHPIVYDDSLLGIIRLTGSIAEAQAKLHNDVCTGSIVFTGSIIEGHQVDTSIIEISGSIDEFLGYHDNPTANISPGAFIGGGESGSEAHFDDSPVGSIFINGTILLPAFYMTTSAGMRATAVVGDVQRSWAGTASRPQTGDTERAVR
jgi:hypothetical protein